MKFRMACRRIFSGITSMLIKGLLRLTCKVDDKCLKRIPMKGPLIIAVNHASFLEVPMLHTHLLPRKTHGIVKKETWDKTFHGYLARVWEAIPVDREQVSSETFTKAKEILTRGQILIIAPEGTRSGDGVLQKGYSGIITIASQTGAPILPLAHYGGENYSKNIKRLKRTLFHFRVGRLLTIKNPDKISRSRRQELTDQLMLHLASLLPEQYRGCYSDISRISNSEFEIQPPTS